ncbi:MAG: TIGR00269 family protein [Candidatus Methanofastidiosa archaeon]|nr:TIGR00269 family protein [Candidatus Methanofastidiosa archaeon]
MKCSRCKKDAIYFQRQSGQYYCGEHFNSYFVKKFMRGIREDQLIKKNEKIGVAVSGGKDSLTLAFLLKKLQARYPFQMEAIIVDEGISGYRNHTLEAAKSQLEKLEIEYHIESFKDNFGKTLDTFVENNKENACSTCGILRRYILNKKARELSCTKLATGHNLDDEDQSVIMNLMRGDVIRFSRGQNYYKKISEKFVERIKPLRYFLEKEIVIFALNNKLTFDSSECPYAEYAMRGEVGKFLDRMEELRPTTKYSLLSGYDKVLPALNQFFIPDSIGVCEVCGEPTMDGTCMRCKILEKE